MAVRQAPCQTRLPSLYVHFQKALSLAVWHLKTPISFISKSEPLKSLSPIYLTGQLFSNKAGKHRM
jgi:hypothetical protein